MIIIRVLCITWFFIYYRCFFLLGFIPFFGFLKKLYNPNSVADAKRFRLFLEKGGPIFIKLGQLLSTRVEVFSETYIKELRNLQDNIAPTKENLVKNVFCKQFNCKTTDVFLEVNEIPIASASIAQVYKAKLLNGDDVILKIVKPNLKKTFKADIAILKAVFKLSELSSKTLRIMKPSKIIKILEDMLNFEWNLSYEAAALDKFKCNFKDNPNIYVPKIYWDYVSVNTLVEEWIDGIKIENITELDRVGINKDILAKNLLELFFQQILIFGFFHADSHGGNILVTNKGKIVLIDFGIIGVVNDTTRIYLQNMFRAFLNQDYKKVADIHSQMGIVNKDINIDLFSLACRAIMEKVLSKPQHQILIGKLVENLLRVSKEFKMEVQSDLLLLQKNMFYIEGIARTLSPNANVWELAKDILNSKDYKTDKLTRVKLQSGLFWQKIENMTNSYIENQKKDLKVKNKIRTAVLWLVFVIIISNLYLWYILY